ncbi:MAG: biopolymer transporter ExbD [Polyangiaceae bacterium]|nr:biopolymer transporter ExbD [Polyangiaceae bacterium]MCE7889924.1 biopolymer transporter ExbD [Sorangiineae bacterium PRO1]MCL4750806.1 biopolymer transporter ExbD [Myxococcales bacterium]
MGIHVSAGKGSRRQQPTPNVNVTPLVDVTLVVLIIFMVVTPLMTKTFWLNLPKQEKTDQPPPPPSDDANKPLVVTVDRAGAIRVNQTVLSKEELKERLPRMLAAKKQKVVYFDAHDELGYGRAVDVLDVARAGGARSIAILTESVVR